MSTDAPDVESVDQGYASRVGARLRSIRKQKRLSLQEVEASSRQEFKASVLGACNERGERAISVPRLQRLAKHYNVPVDQLLPREGPPERAPAVIDLDAPSSGASDPVMIDLQRVDLLEEPERGLLRRYLQMIQVQRGDFNGRVLTVRRDDLRAIACLLDSEPDEVRRRLAELGLRVPA